MSQQGLIDVFVGLAEPVERSVHVRRLAELLGAEQVLIFSEDSETGALLPAPGLPQTFRDGLKWHSFLQDCIRADKARSLLTDPHSGCEKQAFGYRALNGAVLVVLGSQEPNSEAVSQVIAFLPILCSVFKFERKVLSAKALESSLVQNLDRTRHLAGEIDLARRSLQVALTQAELAKQRSTFLSDSSRRLSASLNLETIMEESARLLVPKFADGMSLFLLKDREPTIQPIHSLNFQVSSDVPEVLGELLLETLETASPSRYENETIDLLLIPIRWRSRVNGILALERRLETLPPFSPDDISLLQEYVDRLALSLENSLLFLDAQSGIRTRDEFLSIASHELKTPLTTILLSHQLIGRLIGDDTNTSKHGQQIGKLSRGIQEQLLSLCKLVDTLLDISHVPRGKIALERVEVDLSELILRVVDRFNEQIRRAETSICVQASSIRILCDPIRMEQAISNLITNAIKYGRQRPIEISLETEGGYVSVRIKDHGLGICVEDQKKIFDRFERARNCGSVSGLGLGLYVTKQIVEGHDGTIHVESSLGKGSTFEIRLPASDHHSRGRPEAAHLTL